ncbi:MAG TPA: hypothetical protein VHP33_11545 [Polyangiaceae bacterium]|nr:hypothetical protein [Polyangiaceae bacterium]
MTILQPPAVLACGLALALAACSRPAERQSRPSPSAAPSAVSAKPAAPQAGRKVTLALSGSSLDEAWKDLEAALAESEAPIDSLDIDAFAAPFGNEGLRRLLERQPRLAPIKLTLSNAQLTPAGLSALLASTVPSRLELLDLRDNLLGPAGARVLAESMRLASLRQLNLGRNHLHAHGAAALAGARGLSSLSRLELEYNFIGFEGLRALAQSTSLPNLRDLGLAYNFLGDTGARYLANQRWPALELLDVGSNEIGVAGARALAASTQLSPRAFIWFGSNLESQQLQKLGLQQRLKVDGFPDLPERATLGEADAFAQPKRRRSLTAAAPPEDLPANIDFRELWIWEFGLVAEFPTFMLPQRPPGNGKSRTFTWLDRATLSIGGFWLMPGETTAEALKSFGEAEPGEQLRVERRNAHTIVAHHSDAKQKRLVRAQSAYGALFYVDFSYPAELDPYFAPIAKRVIDSLYFDRAHLTK